MPQYALLLQLSMDTLSHCYNYAINKKKFQIRRKMKEEKEMSSRRGQNNQLMYNKNRAIRKTKNKTKQESKHEYHH